MTFYNEPIKTNNLRSFFTTTSEDLEFKKLIWSGVLTAIQANQSQILDAVKNVSLKSQINKVKFTSFLWRALSQCHYCSILTLWPTATLLTGGLHHSWGKFSYTVFQSSLMSFFIWRTSKRKVFIFYKIKYNFSF